MYHHCFDINAVLHNYRYNHLIMYRPTWYNYLEYGNAQRRIQFQFGLETNYRLQTKQNEMSDRSQAYIIIDNHTVK